jgi:hypothetical protein
MSASSKSIHISPSFVFQLLQPYLSSWIHHNCKNHSHWLACLFLFILPLRFISVSKKHIDCIFLQFESSKWIPAAKTRGVEGLTVFWLPPLWEVRAHAALVVKCFQYHHSAPASILGSFLNLNFHSIGNSYNYSGNWALSSEIDCPIHFLYCHLLMEGIDFKWLYTYHLSSFYSSNHLSHWLAVGISHPRHPLAQTLISTLCILCDKQIHNWRARFVFYLSQSNPFSVSSYFLNNLPSPSVPNAILSTPPVKLFHLSLGSEAELRDMRVVSIKRQISATLVPHQCMLWSP